MEKLSKLFTAIGDLFTGTSWFQYVQWPFWMFLFLIALGGVYTVRFKKNTLFCQGVQGVLKLAMMYMSFLLFYLLIPEVMKDATMPPFLSISDQKLTLVNPLDLLSSWKDALPVEFVRLYVLLLLIHGAASVDYMGKNPIFWFILQIGSWIWPVVLYNIAAFVVDTFLASHVGWIYKLMAAMILLVTFVMVGLKLLFLATMKSGNHSYTVAYQFLTVHRIGSLFSSSIMSVAVLFVFLVLVDLFGNSVISLANINATAFFLIGFMCLMTLAVFNTLFTERKP